MLTSQPPTVVPSLLEELMVGMGVRALLDHRDLLEGTAEMDRLVLRALWGLLVPVKGCRENKECQERGEKEDCLDCRVPLVPGVGVWSTPGGGVARVQVLQAPG